MLSREVLAILDLLVTAREFKFWYDNCPDSSWRSWIAAGSPPYQALRRRYTNDSRRLTAPSILRNARSYRCRHSCLTPVTLHHPITIRRHSNANYESTSPIRYKHSSPNNSGYISSDSGPTRNSQLTLAPESTMAHMSIEDAHEEMMFEVWEVASISEDDSDDELPLTDLVEAEDTEPASVEEDEEEFFRKKVQESLRGQRRYHPLYPEE